jgi:hypothetical protein
VKLNFEQEEENNGKTQAKRWQRTFVKRTHTAISTGLEIDNSHEAGHKAALPRGMLLMLPLECNSADEQY